VRRRHARAFAAALEHAEDGLHGPETGVWLDRIDADRENLRAAIAFALAAGDGETAMRLCGAMWRYWVSRGNLTEGHAFSTAALVLGGGPPDVRMGVLTAAGVLASERGDFAAGRRHFEEMLELALATGALEREARAGSNLANLAIYEGDYTEAIRRYERSVTIMRDLGDTRGLSLMLQNLGLAHVAAGRRERGIELLHESIDFARQAGDPAHLSSALRSLGRLLVPDDAGLDMVRESLLLSHGLSDRPGIVDSFETLAAIADPRTGAMLIGAADAMRAAAGAIRQPDVEEWAVATQAALREALGDAYAAAVEEGAALDPADAVERALAVCRIT
jgi:tetratricopeptide (TPR) repeat protein